MTALLEFQRTLARAVMQPLSARYNMKRGTNRGIAGRRCAGETEFAAE